MDYNDLTAVGLSSTQACDLLSLRRRGLITEEDLAAFALLGDVAYHGWKPAYGEIPDWMPSDELVSDNGRDWYPEPRDAA